MTSTIQNRFNIVPEEGIKAPVRMATTANIALTSLQTIDGVAGAENDRVLVWQQTDASENGIWVQQLTAWVRASDWDDNTDVVSGMLVSVSSGTLYSDTIWTATFSGTFSIDTTTPVFATSSQSGATTLDDDTVAIMVSRSYSPGQMVRTKGDTAAGDGGGATYLVVGGDSSDGKSRLLLANGNTAVIQVTDALHSDQVGGTPAVLHVATTGNDSNTGFDASAPVLTLQAAIDTLSGFGVRLEGEWQISMAAGTYARGRFPDTGLESAEDILIFGPDVGGHPNVPTAIISEGASVSAEGIRCDNRTRIKVKDIKFVGFDGTTSSAGISTRRWGRILTENAHFTDCYWGVSGVTSCYTNVKGGIFDGCGKLAGVLSNGAGGRSLFNTNHAIGVQSAVDTSAGPIFQNGATAWLAQESSSGHLDWSVVKGNRVGVHARINSRFNVNGTAFTNNDSDIRYAGNSHIFLGDDSTFGTGGTESDRKVIGTSGGQISTFRLISEFELANSTTERAYDIKRLDQTIQTTSNTVFHTSTLAAPFWRDASTSIYQGKKLYFKIFGSLAGTNSTKRITARFGGSTANLTFTSSDTGTFIAEGYLYFTDTTEQMLTIKGQRHLGTSQRQAFQLTTEAMTSDMEFTLEAVLGNASDSVVINLVEVGFAG